MKIRDHLWIWGHPENSLHHLFGLEHESHVTPIDGIHELGARNLFYIPMGRKVDRNALSAEMQKECNRFGWSIENPEMLAELLPLKADNPSLGILIFDDFFRTEENENSIDHYSIESLVDFRKKINAAGMELWAVFYERDIEFDLTPFLTCFDGMTFWFWSQPTIEQYESTIVRFIEKTPGLKRMVGCYLYDFGREKSADPKLVERELNRDMDFIRDGKIDGVILHTNAVGGYGEPGYDAAIKWVAENGDKEI